MRPLRHFSLDEANRALPQVAPLLVRLKTLQRTATQLQERLTDLWQRLEQSGSPQIRGANLWGEAGESVLEEIGALQRQLDEQTQEAAGAMQRLEDAGCLLRDVQTGLVDFPAQADGTEILLCWHLGEDAIHYWHGVDEGFAGRKPLSAMPGARLH